ncbi:NAD-P-binding protein [Pilatotrama ljubarskyi]|nr:NAD-P-binding protein [Pilatotrama ljubarskyi]
MSSKQLILVTGINGFLGAHIVDQLVKAGTVRSSKLEFARESNAAYGADVEVVAADDLAFGDFTAVLKDVYGVIHAAAPLVGADTPENALTAAIEGAVNILRQAEKAGIKRYVLVSSAVTIRNPEYPNNAPWKDTRTLHSDWFEVTREQALESKNPQLVYAAEKVLAERAVWEFAEAHPNIDVTALDPPVFIGPFAPNFRFIDALVKELSTDSVLRELLSPSGNFFFPFLPLIDVRDVARSTVHVLTAPCGRDVGRKRLLFLPHALSWKEVAELVAEERPELKDRISKPALTEYSHPAPENMGADATRKSIEVLRLGELTDWKKSVLDGADSYIEAERRFAQEGKTFH